MVIKKKGVKKHETHNERSEPFKRLSGGDQLMDWTLFAVFCILQVLNVVMSTIKSICTIKCNKIVASLVNAIYYGLYTVVLIFMTCELELWLTVVVVS